MSEPPVCSRCNEAHWRFKPCASGTPLFIHRRPREGFVEFGDRMFPETERVGETTFALKREPDLRHGSLRPFQD